MKKIINHNIYVILIKFIDVIKDVQNVMDFVN